MFWLDVPIHTPFSTRGHPLSFPPRWSPNRRSGSYPLVGQTLSTIWLKSDEITSEATWQCRNWLCCGRKARPDFWAIKQCWLCIPQGQLFCLLVPPPLPPCLPT